ncbi:hypothetical protein DFP72DRAFT_1068082 [Ephemerocybe angulata]|uniref:Uncharacterized protein n=1 Tax=Ephemerocybe angulata TaxID=980116 RepID=A0A8H6M8C6_9AGAR|nr:hypothetical protein DFP72DRAFT_1068082 [Tulosesus angulatus]
MTSSHFISISKKQLPNQTNFYYLSNSNMSSSTQTSASSSPRSATGSSSTTTTTTSGSGPTWVIPIYPDSDSDSDYEDDSAITMRISRKVQDLPAPAPNTFTLTREVAQERKASLESSRK